MSAINKLAASFLPHCCSQPGLLAMEDSSQDIDSCSSAHQPTKLAGIHLTSGTQKVLHFLVCTHVSL